MSSGTEQDGDCVELPPVVPVVVVDTVDVGVIVVVEMLVVVDPRKIIKKNLAY